MPGLRQARLLAGLTLLTVFAGCISPTLIGGDDSATLTAEEVGNRLLTYGDPYGSSGSDEFDYYFYPDGTVDYVNRYYAGATPTTHLFWRVEDNTLFVDGGNPGIGAGLEAPRELVFPAGLTVGETVSIKHDGGVYTDQRILAFEEISPRDIASLTESDFSGLTIEISIDGSTNPAAISALSFFEDHTGAWRSRDYIDEFTWSLVASDTLRLDYGEDKYSEYVFTKSIEVGDEVFFYGVSSVSSPISASYYIVGLG